jgi:hypothetical protein
MRWGKFPVRGGASGENHGLSPAGTSPTCHRAQRRGSEYNTKAISRINKKEKQMNLGVRCNFMLPNHCQCPNTALADSDMCELHKEFQTEQAVAAEQAKIEKLEK